MSIEDEELKELMEMFEQRSQQAALVSDLVKLVRRLCSPTGDHYVVREQAMEFLRKHNLDGSPLR